MNTTSEHGGTGNYQNLGDAVAWLRTINPRRVLDVGCGFGRWGFLCREFLDLWDGRTARERWAVHITGVDAFPENLRAHHRHFYDELHSFPIEQYFAEHSGAFDLVVFGDVLEHLPKDRGLAVFADALRRSAYVLLVLPLGADWPQDALYGNPFECHRSHWSAAEVLAHAPLVACRYLDETRRPFLAAVLSRDDPRGLRAILETQARASAAEVLIPRPASTQPTNAPAHIAATDPAERPLHLGLAVGEFLPQAGGIATYIGHLARLLGTAGQRVTIVAPDNSAPPGPLAPNVRIEHCPVPAPAPTGSWATNLYSQSRAWFTACARRLEQLHAADPFDVIEVTDFYQEALGLEPARFLRADGTPVPIITHFHGSFPRIRELDGQCCWPLLSKLEQLQMPEATLRKTYSPKMSTEVERRWPGVACAFVPAPFFRPQVGAPLVADAPSISFDFAYFGRLEHFKGLPHFAAALQVLAQSRVVPRVLMIGSDHPSAPGGTSMRSWLEQELHPHLGDRLTVLPARPRAAVWDLLRRARFIVLPSLWESLGYTGLEAACSGRPMLLSRDAGAAYVFTGALADRTLVNVHDSQDFAARLAAALDERDASRAELATAQHAAVEAEFAAPRVLAATLAYYRNPPTPSAAALTAAREAAAARRTVVSILDDVVRMAEARRADFERLSSRLPELEPAASAAAAS